MPNLEQYGPWSVVALVLIYFFGEIRGLKGRVRKLEGLEVLVERLRNYYDIARENLLQACEFFRSGERPTDTQLNQWERVPSVDDLMSSPPPKNRGLRRPNPTGDAEAGAE
jgi:hypothetical protein